MWLFVRRYVPNLITLGRAVSVYGIARLVLDGNIVFAFILSALVSLTDKWDGDLARKWKCESTLGAYLDIGADKVLCLCLIYFAITLREWSLWFVVTGGISVIYHFSTLLLRAIGSIFRPSNAAKTRMFTEMVVLNSCLLPFAHPYLDWVEWFAIVGMGATVVLTFWSALTYLGLARDMIDVRPYLHYAFAYVRLRVPVFPAL